MSICKIDTQFCGARCLVIGGAGFIGQHLTEKLLSLGADVMVVGLRSCVSSSEKYRYIQADLTQLKSLSVLNDVPYHFVFNLSGYIDHTPYFEGGQGVLHNHYMGLINLLDTIDRSELKAFVQVGSSDEYGNHTAPQQETMREAPISPYSCAKASATHLIQMLAKNEKLPATILRFFLVYGPGQNDQRFLPQMIKGCLQNKSFPVSAGEQLRDFCFVSDVVEAMILSAVTMDARGEVINIASGQPIRIRETIEIIQRQVGRGKPLWGEHPYRQGESMALYASVSKAKRLLGWKAKVSFEEGVAYCIKAFKDKLNVTKEIKL